MLLSSVKAFFVAALVVLTRECLATRDDPPDPVNVVVTRTKGNLSHLVIPIRWSNHKDRTLTGLGNLNVVLNNNGMT